MVRFAAPPSPAAPPRPNHSSRLSGPSLFEARKDRGLPDQQKGASNERTGSGNPAAPEVITEIELHWVRLLSYDTIADFLSAIASYTCDSKPNDGKYTNPHQAIVGALTKALWENQQITEFADLDGQGWGDLECTFVGLATDWYFNQREALRKMRADASDPRAQLSSEEIVEQAARGMAEAVSEVLNTKAPRH